MEAQNIKLKNEGKDRLYLIHNAFKMLSLNIGAGKKLKTSVEVKDVMVKSKKEIIAAVNSGRLLFIFTKCLHIIRTIERSVGFRHLHVQFDL